MAQTMIRDVVIWTKHIHGADGLKEHVSRVRGGEVIDLVVDGVRGPWRRMSDGGDGRPTLGLRPLGQAKALWSELYAARRGEMVHVELASAPASAGSSTTGFREAARAALLQGLGGYTSGGHRMTRDELHRRDHELP